MITSRMLLSYGTALCLAGRTRLEVAHYLDTYFNLDRRPSATARPTNLSRT